MNGSSAMASADAFRLSSHPKGYWRLLQRRHRVRLPWGWGELEDANRTDFDLRSTTGAA